MTIRFSIPQSSIGVSGGQSIIERGGIVRMRSPGCLASNWSCWIKEESGSLLWNECVTTPPEGNRKRRLKMSAADPSSMGYSSSGG